MTQEWVLTTMQPLKWKIIRVQTSFMSPLPAAAGDEWLSLTEAAASLGISLPRLSIIVRNGRIPSLKQGQGVWILRSEIELFRKMPRPIGLKLEKKSPKKKP